MATERVDTTPRTRVAPKSTGPNVVAEPDNRLLGRLKEAEETPAMEVHLGDVFTDASMLDGQRARICIIWLNGQRWQGALVQQEAGT